MNKSTVVINSAGSTFKKFCLESSLDEVDFIINQSQELDIEQFSDKCEVFSLSIPRFDYDHLTEEDKHRLNQNRYEKCFILCRSRYSLTKYENVIDFSENLKCNSIYFIDEKLNYYKLTWLKKFRIILKKYFKTLKNLMFGSLRTVGTFMIFLPMSFLMVRFLLPPKKK